MTRVVGLLRGVSPMNASMPALAKALEAAGYTGVRTLLSSGNVAYDTRAASRAALERAVEAAISRGLGRDFMTLVRTCEELQHIVHTDPFAAFTLPDGAKRVVTFLRKPVGDAALPDEVGGARILLAHDHEVYTAYRPGDQGPVFMTLIEKTFGKDVTTRTWDTVVKCAFA